MNGRRTWLWIEIALCLSYAAVLSLFGLAMTVHWFVVTVVWGADVPARSLWLTLYAASTCLGIVSTLILLRTQLGATTKRASLRLARIGLPAGFATSLLIPGGETPMGWYHDTVPALFAIVLPCLCFAHFAYLARRALFSTSSRATSH